MRTFILLGSRSSIKRWKAAVSFLSLTGAVLAGGQSLAWAAVGTATRMTLTAHGSPVTIVEPHVPITLTATVTAGPTVLKQGQVKFCDTSSSCQDIHLLGLQQLTAAGTATLKFVAGPGEHSYNAIFVGTNTAASSASAATLLTVDPVVSLSSKTTLSVTGSTGSYTLTGNVAGLGGGHAVLPSGSLYFLDKSTSNTELGKGALSLEPPSLNWTNSGFRVSPVGWVAGFASGDFNGDGHLDLIVTSYESNVLDVLLGDGEGRFKRAPGNILAREGGLGDSIAVADFNNDGKLDVLLAPNWVPNDVKLMMLLGNSDGTFTEKTVPTSPDYIFIISGQTADFNGDGNVDILTEVYRADNNHYFQYVLPGNGDGTFQPPIPVPEADDLNRSTVAGDFDGDGKVDLITQTNSRLLSVQYGNGDGTFTAPEQVLDAGKNNTFMFTWADLNGDGRADLVAFLSGNSLAKISLGNADRTFTRRSNLLLPFAGNFGATALLGDFNGDGIVDVGTAVNSSSYPVAISIGLGNGTFTPAMSVPYSGSFADPVPVFNVDFNEDGLSDLVAGSEFGAKDFGYGFLLTQLISTVKISGKAPAGPGKHEVVARYEGDNHFTSSVSQPVALSVPPASTPIATLSSLSVPFGDQGVGETSNAKTAVVTNTGTAALTISSLALSPVLGPGVSFASTNDCPASLAVGATCKIRLRFVPGSVGAKTSQLTITDNAGNSPQVIMLTGRGTVDPD